MPLKLKLDETGHVVVVDNKPIYLTDDGKDVAYDAEYSNSTIARLNKENKEFRERTEESINKLKLFEGIEDPEKALEALQTVANLESGALVAAGKVQEIKDAAKTAAAEQVAAAVKQIEKQLSVVSDERDSIRSELHGEKIGGNFSPGRSKYISEKIAIPSDILQDKFGKHFKYEDKRVVGYDSTGNKIYSRSKPGELADFDECLEFMVDAYPFKDQILKGTGSSGGGSEHGSGGGRGSTALKGNVGGTPQERAEYYRSKHPELDKK